MRSSRVVRSFSLTILLFTICIVLARAEVICRDNGCDNSNTCSCTSSDSCSEEHSVVREQNECRQHHPDLPSTPGHVVKCPYNYVFLEYEDCPNSYSTDVSKTVGDFGKPDWVGVQFQSLSYMSFSMTVMWEHKDAIKLQNRSDLSAVRGYEVKVYQKDNDGGRVLRECLCVNDPHKRNVTDLYTESFRYRSSNDELSHMIVQVRTYPSSPSFSEASTRQNCSLATGCAPSNISEDCVSNDKCYSWPQSCLDFPVYSSETCTPPLYGPPTHVIPQTSLHYDSNFSDDALHLSLDWQPPIIASSLYPMPNIYYITVEVLYENIRYNFKATNTTNVIISPLNSSIPEYRVSVLAYVRCSGLSNISGGLVGCGYELPVNISKPYTPITTSSTELTTVLVSPGNMDKYYNFLVVVLVLGVIVLVVVVFVVVFVKKRHMSTTEDIIPDPTDIVPLPSSPKSSIVIFVFYPKDTEPHEILQIQTYIVAPLGTYSAVKSTMSTDDHDFQRGTIPGSVDRNFRNADYVIIVCNSLFLLEWNSDCCSPIVQLLKHYIGCVSICNDDSIKKFITVVLDDHKRKELIHSRQNLGILRNFVINENTWSEEIPKIVRYMTGTPLFEITRQEEALHILDTPDSPDLPSSQELYYSTSTPRTSSSTLSDTGNGNNQYTVDGDQP